MPSKKVRLILIGDVVGRYGRKFVQAVLPLDIDARSEGLQGTIRIIRIDDLQFGDKHLSCRLHVAGSDLHGQGGWKGWQNTATAGAPASSTYAFAGTN